VGGGGAANRPGGRALLRHQEPPAAQCTTARPAAARPPRTSSPSAATAYCRASLSAMVITPGGAGGGTLSGAQAGGAPAPSGPGATPSPPPGMYCAAAGGRPSGPSLKSDIWRCSSSMVMVPDTRSRSRSGAEEGRGGALAARGRGAWAVPPGTQRPLRSGGQPPGSQQQSSQQAGCAWPGHTQGLLVDPWPNNPPHTPLLPRSPPPLPRSRPPLRSPPPHTHTNTPGARRLPRRVATHRRRCACWAGPPAATSRWGAPGPTLPAASSPGASPAAARAAGGRVRGGGKEAGLLLVLAPARRRRLGRALRVWCGGAPSAGSRQTAVLLSRPAHLLCRAPLGHLQHDDRLASALGHKVQAQRRLGLDGRDVEAA
jgi:hypothetical protein